jgi:hypothetical protein
MRSRTMRSTSATFALGVMLAAAACSDPAGPEPVAAVEISEQSLALGPSESRPLTVTVRGVNGSVLAGRDVSWGTSDHLVATVTAQGAVTAHAFGVATIVATVEGKTAQAVVTVTATQPAHLAGLWRMRSFDGKTLPAAYAVFYDEVVGDRVVEVVEIRLDSARVQLRDDGLYPFRQYCFTELHDLVPMFKYCWGDHGRFVLGNPPGRIVFTSEYIQNLSAAGTVTTAGEVALTEPLWVSETPRSTIWRR